jgi:predicted lipoprotein with Yx(FWY)xxD motif
VAFVAGSSLERDRESDDTYVEDAMPGDAKGDNVGNVWHVIR